ncbi:MAG: DUF456 domain-containing protein [Firmicutes bacterium]|nr:DUF456 domain-containing protein [Bacillota bacterium]
MTVLVFIGVFLLMLLGLVGTFVPVLPGTGLIFLGIFLYALYDRFQVVTGPFVAAMFALTLLTMATDYVAGALGARRVQASRAGILGAALGGVVGLFIFGPVGIIVGPLLGAVTGEVASGRTMNQALRVGVATVVGTAGGMVLKAAVGLAMILLFVLRVT